MLIGHLRMDIDFNPPKRPPKPPRRSLPPASSSAEPISTNEEDSRLMRPAALAEAKERATSILDEARANERSYIKVASKDPPGANKQCEPAPLVPEKREFPWKADEVASPACPTDIDTSDIDNLYHNNHFSEVWLITALILHVVQFTVLFTMGYRLMTAVQAGLNLFFVGGYVLLLALARSMTQKKRGSATLDWLSRSVRSPADETDVVSDAVIYTLAAAALFEGVSFALFPTFTSGYDQPELNSTGYYSSNTIVQTLSFATITFYAIHRVLRPANRLDPMRTVLELEAVNVCWDALDGSSLFELFQEQNLGPDIAQAAEALMIFWYLSVGIRLSMMFCAHLDPNSVISKLLITRPKSLSPDPTVDRSLQSMRLRSLVTLSMTFAEFFALGLRVTLWIRGRLSSTQQEMMIKNFLFLSAVVGAYGTFTRVDKKNWNSRYILGVLKKPSRLTQVQILRWAFAVSYVVVGAMFSSYLVHVTGRQMWILNVGTDCLLAGVFLLLCREVHNKKVWVLFPLKIALGLGAILVVNMYVARIVGIFSSADMADPQGDSWSYNNALLVVSISVVPIASYGLFWSTSFMIFYPEFTAAPGNYNAIHDPIITLVSVATMVEGALDVVSCSSLMSLAVENLPRHINGAIVLFSYLEIINACQSFAFQALLSGGHNDTPIHLVKWRARLRVGRGIIDFGALFLRVFLWVQYDAMTYIFLVKNLYNIIHTIAEIERAGVISKYSKDILFAQFVRPQDWYGLTQSEWRTQTSDTITFQAQAGRHV